MTVNQLVDLSLESLVSSHVAATEFRRRPNCREARHVLHIGENDLPYNLTGTTLAGPDLISQEPFVLTDDKTGTLIAFYRLGCKLAGHSKIIHGGLAAVLLDECMGRACFPRFTRKSAMTAKLDISYKAPVSVNSIVVIRAQTIEVQGRKAWVEASIEDAEVGTILVEAKALFIEPKWESGTVKGV
jgi:acyl-coenzyme A thioesterase PaaI-like protein